MKDNYYTELLVALVFRLGKGCRQYCFKTVDELKAWSTRHPYRRELLRVMVVKDKRIIGEGVLPADLAGNFVCRALKEAAK